MSLTVALVLSGLEADQWSGDLKDMYNQGISLLNGASTGQERNRNQGYGMSQQIPQYYRMRKSSSVTSVGSGSSSASSASTAYHSMESSGLGAASVSPDTTNSSRSSQNGCCVPGHSTQLHLDELLAKLSELRPQEYVNTEDLKKPIAKLPESPPRPPQTVGLMLQKQKHDEYHRRPKIMYHGIDILNLGWNLTAPVTRSFQPAELKPGVNWFFDNRSQCSRVKGVPVPRHINLPCCDNNCDFMTPMYY